MRIGLFVLMAGRHGGGPETYEIELLRAIARMDQRNEFIVYCTGDYAVDAIGVRQDNFRYQVLKPALRPISIGLTLPYLMRRDGLDFYHATFTPPPFSACPMVFTMHCISSLVHPEFYPRWIAMRLNHLLKAGMARCQHMVCVSQTTLEHVHSHYGIPRQKMSVAYNGVGSLFQELPAGESRSLVLESLGIDRPYILFIGKLQKHKNLVRLVQAFDRFRRATSSDAMLVLAGKPVTGVDELELTIQRLGLKPHVKWLGYLPDSTLPHLYGAARMFAFPSLWEGFGIPLIEAMACGTPVIASNSTCLPEVAGGAARIFDPLSIEDMANAMADVDGSEEFRTQLIAKGRVRARDFSWDNCARSTLKAYETLGYQLPS